MDEIIWSSNKTHHCSVRAVVNISNQQLSAFEELALNKGLDFTTESSIFRHNSSSGEDSLEDTKGPGKWVKMENETNTRKGQTI